ncbi:MAG: ornithine cyclodeaminase family protein [Acidobacteria bacterium]|nr:ornithine cyclodeaminase family protein [Acidobacteriota bacterium]
MDVLYLTEADVERLLSMEMALEVVESAFRTLASGQAQDQPRQRLRAAAGTWLHYMAAAEDAGGYFGMKLYTSSPEGVRFLVPLYRGDTGRLVALLEADTLGRMRTGAASGVATKYMARPDAARVAILGTGHQAPTQLLALARVRRLERVHAYSPNAERRRRFAEEMSSLLSVPVEALGSAAEAVREADIVVVVTSAKQPVLEGAWLAPGTHINAVGANFPQKRELDDVVIQRAARIVVDSRAQARSESGDLIIPFEGQPERWQQVRELSEVVAGRYPGREKPDEITLFKSNGVAIEDVATAARVYERGRAEGVGRTLAMWEP